MPDINRVVTLSAQQNLDSDGADLVAAPVDVPPKKKIFSVILIRNFAGFFIRLA